MLSLILISPGDCGLGGRRSRRLFVQVAGAYVSTCLIPFPLVRMLTETYSKISLVIICTLSGGKKTHNKLMKFLLIKEIERAYFPKDN